MKLQAPGDASLAMRELQFLQRLVLTAASVQRPDDLVDLIIRETTGAMETDVCSVYLLQPDGQTLLLVATNGLDESMSGRASMALGEGITGWVAETRQPATVPDVSRDPHWKWVPGLDQARLLSMLSVPIESGTRLVGVLNVQTAARREYTQGDIDFLRAIAGQVAGILERSELQRRLEIQLAALRTSHDVHERFTRLSLEGAGIPALLEAVGNLAAGRPALYSVDGYRIRGSGEAEGSPSRVHIPPALLEGREREVRVSAGRPPRPTDLVPVRAGTEVLAVLAVSAEDDADHDARRRALEHGATVLALELSKERAAAEVERRLRGDLVEQLLSGGLDEAEAERVAHQAERLGHRLPNRAWVMVLEPDDEAAESEMSIRSRQDRLDTALSDLVTRRMPGALLLVRSASVVLLVPEEAAPDFAAAEKLAGLVLSTAAAQVRPATLSIGVGNLAESVAELDRSHQEARQALRLSRRAGVRGQATSYRSLGAFRLLLEVSNPQALSRFVEEVLGPLLRYAQSRETPLLETLDALAAARWVRRQAARALGIHINSMSYRVERIESLTGLSLDDPETRVAIAIALRARAMLGR